MQKVQLSNFSQKSINLNKKKIEFERNPFHLVQASPWPFMVSLSLLCFVLSIVMYFYYYYYSEWYILFFFIFVCFSLVRWFRDIIIESTFQGFHTFKVQKGLKLGMILFLLSEVMFFFTFFWAFFHYSLAPSIWIGSIWPPIGIEVINPWGLPLLNTIISVSSGVGVTFAHRSILCGFRQGVINGLTYAIFLGILFTLLQIFEYSVASFNINDSVYGSIFYLATGFHGFHVIIGTIFLLVTLIRHIKYHFLIEHHFGLEASIWYWHFVDVIWLFLFVIIYWWGGK